MPLVRNRNGQQYYVKPVDFYREHAENFLSTEEYQKRVDEARRRVLNAIRFACIPLSGRGTNHKVKVDRTLVGSRVSLLVDFVDQTDRRRIRKLRTQRHREETGGLAPGERRLRSPQPIDKRRSALFSGSDIPPGYFDVPFSKYEMTVFVDLMRWVIIEDAVLQMQAAEELNYIDETWYVSVCTMDIHVRKHSKRRTKVDQRPFHGRPGRDRGGKRQRSRNQYAAS